MMRQTTKPERQLVKDAIRLVAETEDQYAPLMPPGVLSHPLPFFGAVSSARIITLGLNPSSKEFASARGWPRQIESDMLAQRLVSYFDNDSPAPHQWFKPWSVALGQIGASYKRDAAHIDLSPRATRSARQFKYDPMKSLFLNMLLTDAPLWIATLQASPKVAYVLAAGSATNKYYINEFVREELTGVGITLSGDWHRSRGPGQTALRKLSLPGGREIPFFFCSTGPRNGSVLIQAVCARALQLRRWIE